MPTIRGAPCSRDAGQARLRTTLTGRSIALRRRQNGPPTRSEGQASAKATENRRCIRGAGHGLASRSDRRNALVWKSTFLITAQGKPFSAAGFGNWFRDVCNQAGLPKRCTSHGLRKAAATYLADRGATTTQLMAWFGWKTASEAECYTRGADRKRNAAAAGALVSRTGIGKPEIQFAKKKRKILKTQETKS
jgi:integrase